MTELTIIPKISDKTARFKGTVAAGEHVAVTIKGGAEWLEEDNASHLSLRVLDLVTGRTLALFPRPPETLDEGEEPDEWEESQDDPADLFCNLNLNTDRMVNAARHMLRVPVLFVLGACDPENPETTRTLYFRDRYVVEYWPERVGDDTPYDLDKWPRKIDEWTELVDEWTARLQRLNIAAVRTGDQPTGDVGHVTITLNKGTSGESDTVVKVYDGLNGQDGHDGETTHEWVEERFLALEGGEMGGPIAFPVSGDGQSITCTQDGIIVTDGTKSYEFTASGNSTGDNTVARLSDVATKQNTLTFDSAPTADSTNPVTSGGVKTAIDAVAGDVDDIKDLIPDTASSSNQLADTAFVNSSIATNTANYISNNGEPFESVTALNAYSGTKTNNDYAFVVGEDSVGNKTYTRYKWTGSAWAAEYVLNNSSFTSEQWAAITSGITSSAVTKLSGIEAGAEVNVIETVKVNGTALTPSGKAVDIPIPATTATLAQETYDSTDNSVMVDVPSKLALKLKFRNVPSNTVNTLDTSASGTIATREWVQQEIDVPSPSDDDPAPNGIAWEGESDEYSRADHVHPTDSTRQASITASGILKGNGSGGVSAAVAGTDYQAPLTIDATPTASSTNPVQSGGVKTALDGKLSTAGATRSVTAEDSGGTETYKFSGTGETTDANAIARIKSLPYVNVGEAAQMLVGVYGILSRGVQRHTATSGETSATFGFADAPGSGKVADAILDIDNSGNTSALGLEFSGLGTTFTLVAPDGDDLAEMTSVDGGKQARFYFTETALVSNNLPVISVQRITLGAVATAITRGS